MSLPAGGLRFPRSRVLLPRTRLAYVHLRNLFTDAKRDRAARVFGYVCVWLPDGFLLFFMQEGEIVNATASPDGLRFHPIAIADAVARVPREAEYGEVCFHEADDEQLAIIYWSQALDPAAWPPEVDGADGDAVLGFLRATMHDGVLEIQQDEERNYAVVREGVPVRGYFAHDAPCTVEERVRALLAPADRAVRLRLWPVPPPVPTQAPPALIQGYRELMANAVRRLQASGVPAAATIAEHARRNLAAKHPSLDLMALAPDGAGVANPVSTMAFGRSTSQAKDPITEAGPLSAAIGAWLAEVLWTTPPGDGATPEAFLGDLLRDRRHMFQGAGLLDALPWKPFG